MSCFDVERRNAKRLKKSQQDASLNPATLGLGNLAASYNLAHYAAANTPTSSSTSTDAQRPMIPHHVFLSHNLFPAYQHLASQHAPLIQQVVPAQVFATSPFATHSTTSLLPSQQSATLTVAHNADFLEVEDDEEKWKKFLLGSKTEQDDDDENLLLQQDSSMPSPLHYQDFGMMEQQPQPQTLVKSVSMVPSGCVAFPSIGPEHEEMCISVWTLEGMATSTNILYILGKLFSANVQFLQQFKVPKHLVQSFHPMLPNDTSPQNSSYLFDSENQCVNIKQILFAASRHEASAIIEKVLSGNDLPFFSGEIDCCTYDDDSLLSKPSLLKTLFAMYVVKAGKDRTPKYAVSHISVLK